MLSKNFLFSLLFQLLFARVSMQCKILVTTDGLTSSHVMFHYRIAETLAENGFDVTFFHAEARSGVLSKTPHPKIKYWKHQANPDPHVYDRFSEAETENAFKSEQFDWSMLARVGKIAAESCEFQLNNQKLMADIRESKFDLVFGHTVDLCWLGMVHLFKIPSFVWHYEGRLWDIFNYELRIPAPPSFVTHVSQTFTDRMNLKERAINSIASAATPLLVNPFIEPVQEVFQRKFGSDFPTFESLLPKSKLAIMNSEEFLDFPKPIFHKILYAGGLGIEEPKPLNDKWKKIIEDPRYKGTVLFSLGSVVKAHKIPMNIQVALANGFKRLSDYQFIMKLDEKIPEMQDIANIHIEKWVPQADLLGKSKENQHSYRFL